MRHAPFAAAVLTALAPFSADAIELLDDGRLEIYGKLHVSADLNQTDLPDQDGLSFSSNSSRIGFRGAYPLAPSLDLLYQIEQEIQLDDEAGDGFATRESFLGAKGDWGELRLGRLDTPFKSLGSDFTLMGDTVADHRAILGASAGNGPVGEGNKVNIRARNAIGYTHTFGERFAVAALYSTGWDDGNSGYSDTIDDHGDLYSLGGGFAWGSLEFGAAYEHIERIEGGDLDGLRLGAAWEHGALKVGLIYESLDHDVDASGLSRDAWGGNFSYTMNKIKWMAQILRAEDSDGVSDSGAMSYSLGATYHVAEPLGLYAVATATDNDDNAEYQIIDGGHGDELDTTVGGEGYSLSAGAVVTF